MSRVKGPWFPSYNRQERQSNKQILVWTPGTQSMRQRKKYLRNACRRIIDSTDPLVIAAGDRVIRSICEEPDPEFSALHLFYSALGASTDTGEPWHVCMNYFMDKFEGKVPSHVEVKKDTSDKPASGQSFPRLRRILQKLVPRPLRQSNEEAAIRSVDQPTGAIDAQHENVSGHHHESAD